jgi:hypothetical protein
MVRHYEGSAVQRKTCLRPARSLSFCQTSREATTSATFRIRGLGGLSVAAGRGEQPRGRRAAAWLLSATGSAIAAGGEAAFVLAGPRGIRLAPAPSGFVRVGLAGCALLRQGSWRHAQDARAEIRAGLPRLTPGLMRDLTPRCWIRRLTA